MSTSGIIRVGRVGHRLPLIYLMRTGRYGAIGRRTARLAGQTIEYIHVSSIDQAKGRLAGGAIVLQDVRTRGGTRELLVEDNADLFILAEKVA